MHPLVKGDEWRLPSELSQYICEMREWKGEKNKKTQIVEACWRLHEWKLSQALNMLCNQAWLTDVWFKGPVLGKNHFTGIGNQAFSDVAKGWHKIQIPLPHYWLRCATNQQVSVFYLIPNRCTMQFLWKSVIINDLLQKWKPRSKSGCNTKPLKRGCFWNKMA